MKANAIIDVYQARFRELSKYYHVTLEDFKPKDIHCFRVELKKLRAFIRLINLASVEDQAKIPKSLKRFYNITGNIRNLQLHQQRVNELCKDLNLGLPSSYMQFLKKEEQVMKEKARQMTGEISMHNFETKLISKVPEQLDKKVKTAFVQKRETRLEELFTLPLYYDEGLHEIRKLVKDLVNDYKYIGKFVDAELPSGVDELKEMEPLTIAVGGFHDLCVALFLLSPVYVEKVTDHDEMQVLNKIKSELQLRKEHVKKEITESLNIFKKQVEKEKALVQAYEVLH
jgi:CHAD domain-containing protein